MKNQVVKIDMETFGAQFANMDDTEQAAFFRGLASELETWPSIHQGEVQFCSIGELLTDGHKTTLSRVLSALQPDKEGK